MNTAFHLNDVFFDVSNIVNADNKFSDNNNNPQTQDNTRLVIR